MVLQAGEGGVGGMREGTTIAESLSPTPSTAMMLVGLPRDLIVTASAKSVYPSPMLILMKNWAYLQ